MSPTMISSPEKILHYKGFSLVELIVALAVLSILLLIAAPSFNTVIKNNRLYSQINHLHLSLMRARSEALTRAQRVTVCASNDTDASPTCGGKWEDGWVVFVEDHNSQNASIDANEVVIQVNQGLSGNSTLRGSANVKNYVSYSGTGFSTLANGTSYQPQTGFLVLCDERGLGRGRSIGLNANGRPQSSSASASGFAKCDPNSP